MLPVSLNDVCCAVAGRPNRSISPWLSVTSVTQSSKEATPDSLFVALRGERVDGHSYIREALDKGAICCIVEKFTDDNVLQFLVPSTVDAMGDLARLYHARLAIPVVAVTGSVGKTSTKEMISHILGSRFKVHKGRQNFNNELGVPIETFRIKSDDQISVLEVAMRGRNQISYLSKMIRPKIAIVTNVGISHIEILGSSDQIALAKREIVDGMDSSSTLILNKDDARYAMMRDAAKGNVVSFGEHTDADFRVSGIQFDIKGRPSFIINGVPIVMANSMGKQHAFNGAAAFAACTLLGMKNEEIKSAVQTFKTPTGRGVYSLSKSEAHILDHSYNAAPDSIRSSLLTLADLKSKGNRIIAVIGDMLELGAYSEEAHRHVGKLAKEIGVDVLVTVGESSKFVGDEAKVTGWQHCGNAVEAAKYLLTEVQKNDVVMIQGSRVMLLDYVVECLEKGELSIGPSAP